MSELQHLLRTIFVFCGLVRLQGPIVSNFDFRRRSGVRRTVHPKSLVEVCSVRSQILYDFQAEEAGYGKYSQLKVVK